MGATITKNAEYFNEYVGAAYDVKDRNLQSYTANLRTRGYWADLNSRDNNKRVLADKVRVLVSDLQLNRNDTYLVAGLVSYYYEDILADSESLAADRLIDKTEYKNAFLTEQIKNSELTVELDKRTEEVEVLYKYT